MNDRIRGARPTWIVPGAAALLVLFQAVPAFAQAGAGEGTLRMPHPIWWVAPAGSILALIFAWVFL